MNTKPRAYSIRSLLEDLRLNHQEEILEIDDDVSVEFETTAYYLKLRKRNQVLLFNKIMGYGGFSLVTNIFGSDERFARIAGFSSIREVVDHWTTVSSSLPSEKIATSGNHDSFQKTFTGEKVNLFDLPIPSHYELDGSRRGYGRYVTGGLTTTIDPENEETVNLSFSRIQPFEKNRFAFDAGSRGHLWKYLDISRRRNERLKMTIIIGTNPIFYILGASFIDNEFAKAQRILDVHFDSGYLNPIPIPSDTEIAIEAEFLPEEHFEEGPFAEYIGYMGYDSTDFVAEVKSILMKRNPIYYDIQPSNSMEHVNLFSIPRSSLVMNRIREALPKGPVYQVIWPHYGGRFLALGYAENCEIGLAKQLGISVLGLDPLWNKIVFINAGTTRLDINTALSNLAKLDEYSPRNVIIVPGSFVISSDPTRDEQGNTGKVTFLTKAKDSAYEIEENDGSVYLKSPGGNVVITHRYREDQKVNVILASDIEVSDEEQVGWALATRCNPERDIKVERERIVIMANREVPSVARVPEVVMKKIGKRL